MGSNGYGFRYVDVFARISGAKTLNYGISGTRIARKKRVSQDVSFDRDFIMRCDEMADDIDVVVVLGGTNDFGYGDAAFGNFGEESEYTFYGAMNILCRKLINKYPRAQIVFLTPMHRLGENETVNELGLECKPLKSYVEAIKEVAEYYSIPVLDMWKVSGLQPSVDIIKEIYLPDGLHPSDAGAEVIANKNYSFIKTL